MKASPEQAERLHTFAHDLRNRLIGLQQVLTHLKEEGTAEERAEFVLYGEQQFFKALREVERVMDDFGVERGTVVPVVHTVHLATLVRERIELIGHRTDRKRQTIALDLDHDIHVLVDARIIGDLLDALFSNASKFSGTGTTIHINLRSVGDMVELSVRDEGTGLVPEDLDRIFTRFAWLSNRPTAGEAQGRGTLARAAEWARAHHGELSVSSLGEGHGCTFLLRLPATT